MTKEKFLSLATDNSVVIMNDWLYIWKPYCGKEGVLIAADNDLSDVPLDIISFNKIQNIRKTEEVWSEDEYDFETEFPEDIHKF